MSKPDTNLVILLAPIGAGKSTRVRHLRSQEKDLSHIDRDDMMYRMLKKRGIDARQSMDAVTTELCKRVFNKEAVPAYYERLDAELHDNNPRIVVDFPSGGSGEWIGNTIERARAAERHIVVEGIYIHPEESLLRTLKRNTTGMEVEYVEELIADSNFLKHWLSTYQKFPEQFTQAAAMANEARLFDNSAERKPVQKVIAEWSAQARSIQPTVYDDQAYKSFLNLGTIDVANADCAIDLKLSYPQGDTWWHEFDIKPNDAFRPTSPIQVKASMNQAIS